MYDGRTDAVRNSVRLKGESAGGSLSFFRSPLADLTFGGGFIFEQREKLHAHKHGHTTSSYLH